MRTGENSYCKITNIDFLARYNSWVDVKLSKCERHTVLHMLFIICFLAAGSNIGISLFICMRLSSIFHFLISGKRSFICATDAAVNELSCIWRRLMRVITGYMILKNIVLQCILAVLPVVNTLGCDINAQGHFFQRLVRPACCLMIIWIIIWIIRALTRKSSKLYITEWETLS